jgi:hypothetical protein
MFERNELVRYFNGSIQQMVIVDEVLDNNQYAVRFLDADETFVVAGSSLT